MAYLYIFVRKLIRLQKFCYITVSIFDADVLLQYQQLSQTKLCVSFGINNSPKNKVKTKQQWEQRALRYAVVDCQENENKKEKQKKNCV